VSDSRLLGGLPRRRPLLHATWTDRASWRLAIPIEPSATAGTHRLGVILEPVETEPRIGRSSWGRLFERPNGPLVGLGTTARDTSRADANITRGDDLVREAVRVRRALPHTTDLVEPCFHGSPVRAAASRSSSGRFLTGFDEAAAQLSRLAPGRAGRHD
jgi:hypothetical protein